MEELTSWERRGFDIVFFKARAYYEWGHAYYSQGDYESAFEKYAEATVFHAQKPQGGAGAIFPFESGVKQVKQKTEQMVQPKSYCKRIIKHWQLNETDKAFPVQFETLQRVLSTTAN